jgi:hypothetical protein
MKYNGIGKTVASARDVDGVDDGLRCCRVVALARRPQRLQVRGEFRGECQGWVAGREIETAEGRTTEERMARTCKLLVHMSSGYLFFACRGLCGFFLCCLRKSWSRCLSIVSSSNALKIGDTPRGVETCHISGFPPYKGWVSQKSSRLESNCPRIIGCSAVQEGAGRHKYLLPTGTVFEYNQFRDDSKKKKIRGCT